AKGGNLSQLDADNVGQFHPSLDADVLSWLDPAAAADRRTSLGGTAWGQVEEQVRALRGWVAAG
ncbi:MAG: hypothetical protein AAF602_32105, partial [Myxococcota bacterium]